MPMAAGFTIKDDDGKDVCREFQRDLMNCGFRGEHIVKHYDELRNHLYELRRSFNDKSLDITILQVNASSGQSPRSGEMPKPRKVSVHIELQQDEPRRNGDQMKPKINQNTEQPLPPKPKRYFVNGKIVEMDDSTQEYHSEPDSRRQHERRTRQQQFRPESPSGWSSASTVGSRPSMKEHQRPFVHNYKAQVSPEQSNPAIPGQVPGMPVHTNHPMYTGFQPIPNPYISSQNGYPPPQAYYAYAYQNTPMSYFQPPPLHQGYTYGASFTYPYPPYPNQYPNHENNTTTPQPTNQHFPHNFPFDPNKTQANQHQPVLQLTWEKVPQKDLHPLIHLPTLPEGWDWRLDKINRLFYVDTYAHGQEKRCFWKPPIEEPHEEESRNMPGWERTCTIYGRVFWTHVQSKIVSYEFPGSCRQFKHSSAGELHLGSNGFDAESLRWRHWSSVDLGLFVLDDSEVACRISRKVWREGISDEAVGVRGELWWGNPSVWQRCLRLSTWCRPSVESVLSEVEVPLTGDDGLGDDIRDMGFEDKDGFYSGNATCNSVRGSSLYMSSNYQRASVEDITEDEAHKQHAY
ncbi:hypothetical protein N7499_009680 [Penicillium canescens]|nr:hypothetical protein N7499_009680 [Penicillium canescens]KAJ6170347.1 hypothetical protein N7485_007693 [Penicillium canescens]